MNPSKRFQRYLEVTGNYRFRQRIDTLSQSIHDDAEWMQAKLSKRDFEQIDYLAYKLSSQSRLLYRIMKLKTKTLHAKGKHK